MPNVGREAGKTLGWFNRFAQRSAHIVGSPYAFLFAITSIVLWLAAGSYFKWSNSWQLVVNSLTNIATYLVVFIIQNSQNRDSEAINLKLNELILANRSASNELLNVEELGRSRSGRSVSEIRTHSLGMGAATPMISALRQLETEN